MNVEIEHYGGEKKSVEVLTVSEHYKEIQVMWTGTTNERVTFSLRNGLIIAPTAQRNWRLTKESFDEMRNRSGMRPGHLHRWDVAPPRKPHVPRTKEDPRQEKLF